MFKFLKYIVFVILSFIVKFNGKPGNERKSYLFVNTGQIGDLVVSSLILENDDLFKNIFCYLLIVEKYSELFNGYKGSINIISFNKNKYRYNSIYRLKFLKQIRKLNIFTAYNITAARGFINDELTLLSGADKHFATCGSHKYLGKYAGKRFDTKYDAILFPDIKNEYDKTINLIHKITKTENDIIIINKKTFHLNSSFVKEEKYITISPFSTNKIKDWPVENYEYIVQELSKYVKIILLGSDDHKNKFKKMKNNLSNVDYINCSLDVVQEQIYNSELYIGNDSGLTHIAYRLGKPVFILLGGGCYGKYFPYKKLNEGSKEYYKELPCFGCDWKCIHFKPYCITEISKKVVLNDILQYLNIYAKQSQKL